MGHILLVNKSSALNAYLVPTVLLLIEDQKHAPQDTTVRRTTKTAYCVRLGDSAQTQKVCVLVDR